MRRDRSALVVLFQISLGALLPGLFMDGVAFPQTSFFQGKTVTILESSAPGGVGSMRTKAVVPFLQKYTPGNPTVVMQYMDGGGGRKAANHLYKSVRRDGLTIGRMSTPFVMQPILGESGVLYDIDKVSYLGTSYSGGYHVFFTRREAGLDSLEKLRAASGLRIGSQSVGHLIYISGRMFAHLIGLRQPRFVTGYASPADIESFAKTALERKLVALYRTFVGSGNPFILPPGTPKDRLKTLQEAMRKTYRDADFFKEYTKLTGLKAEPQMPEELEQTIRDMPRDREAVELFKKLTGPDPLPQR